MQCGWCSVLTALMRRAMCVGSRRGSGDSYYRDLHDPDTVRLHLAAEFLGQPAVEPAAPCIEDGIRHDDVQHYIDSSPESESLCQGSRPRKLDRFHTLHKRRRKRLKAIQDCCLVDAALHGQVQLMLSGAALWRFDMFALDNTSGGRSIPILCVHLFHHYDLFAHFRLDRVAVWKLFSLIEEGYRADNPYHNATHAADVTQAMHCFMQQSQILVHLEPIDVLACIVGAVAHDVEHPGVNQAFLAAQQSHLAKLYRNASVLENHHWRAAMSCLAQSGVLQQVSPAPVRARLRRTVRDLVLATDITRQQEFLSHFKMYLDGNLLNLARIQDKQFILQIALKCADISNPCRIWPLSRLWSLSVCEEFYLQGDLEKRMNFPVTFDRNTTSIPNIQVGFLKFVVTPLVREWHRFLQSDLSLQMLQNLRNNLNRWDGLLGKATAGENIELCSKEIETVSLRSFSIRLNRLFSSQEMTSKNNNSVNKCCPISSELQDEFKDNSVNVASLLSPDTKETLLELSNNHKNNVNYKHVSCLDTTKCSASALMCSQYTDQDEFSKYCKVEIAARSNVSEKTSPGSLVDRDSSNAITDRRCDERTVPFVRQRTFPPTDGTHMERHATLHRSVDGCSLTAHNIVGKGRDTNTSSVHPVEDILGSLKVSDAGVALKKYSKDKPEWYSLRRRLMSRRDSAPVGSQLKDNITSVPLGLSPLRRSSEPSVDFRNGDKNTIGSLKLKAVSESLCCPEMGASWSGRARRGSAPVLGSPAPAPLLQRWLRHCSAHIRDPVHVTQRRSSLPLHSHFNLDKCFSPEWD